MAVPVLNTWTGRHIRLRRSHRARVQRQPTDLILEGSGDTAVHLRADPDMALEPSGQVPQLLDLWVVLQCWVPHLSYNTRACGTEFKVARPTMKVQKNPPIFGPCRLQPACRQASGAKCPHFCAQDLQALLSSLWLLVLGALALSILQLRGTSTERERARERERKRVHGGL